MILLVGYGYWGKNLARNFGKNLVAICEQDPAKQMAALELYPDVTMYDKIDEALKNDKVKAVALATKAHSHYDLAIKCIDAGKDLWIEKPVCETLDQVYDLNDYAVKKDKIVFVDHTFCYHPAVVKMKKLQIGNPLYYDSQRISLGLFQPDVDVALDLAIHDTSILNYFYPDLELAEKQIVKNSHINEQANQVIINLKFTNKFTACINCNWVSPVKKRQIILAGSDASVVYDDLENDKLKIYHTGEIDKDFSFNSLGDIVTPHIKTTEALANGAKAWINGIQTRTRPLTDITNSIKPMEWLYD
jgi:predicted dehydrogenase